MATAQVTDKAGYYGGEIDLTPMSPEMRQTFEEYEEIVNGQMFTFLDEIEGKVEANYFKVVFESGQEAAIEDLQILPRKGKVSFKLARGAVLHKG